MAKLIITADQLMRLLDSESIKLPITVHLKGMSKEKQKELFDKIKKEN